MNRIAQLLIASAFVAPAIAKEEAPATAYQYLQHITSSQFNGGSRVGGSEEERMTAHYIHQQFGEAGFVSEIQTFKGKTRQGEMTSQNVIAFKDVGAKQTLIIGAHYDSVGQKSGSFGAADNGGGTALLLAIAKQMAKVDSKYNLKLIAFGAEEMGLQGSRYYVNNLPQDKPFEDVVGMINLDTVVGGDKLYVHSAHSTPYKCRGLNKNNYSSSPMLRDQILATSKQVLGDEAYALHPDYAQYPEGETGSWSDHAGFACAGLPIAYIEATNFALNGKNGHDGYSQTAHEQVWNCFDAKQKGACDREDEKKWGMIWHTEFDQIDRIESLFPKRLASQLERHSKVLMAFLTK